MNTVQVQADTPEMQAMAEQFVNHVDQGEEQVEERAEGNVTVRQAPSRNVTVWHIPTGDKRLIPIDLLRDDWGSGALQQRDEFGQPVFSIEPVELKGVGQVKCRLHPDDPDRDRWDSMGLPRCAKADLDNSFQARNHLNRYHKTAADAINADEAQRREERFAQERREDMDRQLAILEKMTILAEGRPIEPQPAKPRGSRAKQEEGDGGD